MIGNIERVIAGVAKVAGPELRVSVSKRGDIHTVSVSFGDEAPSIVYDHCPQWDQGVLSERGRDVHSDTALAVKAAVDTILAPVDEAYLDALPDDTIVRVVEVIDLRSRTVEQGSLFQKFGRGWVEMDPSDRNDGEDVQPSGYLLAKARRFKNPDKGGDLGRVEVVFVQDAE